MKNYLQALLLLASFNLYSMQNQPNDIDTEPDFYFQIPQNLSEEFLSRYQPPHTCNQLGSFFIKKGDYQVAQDFLLHALAHDDDLPTKLEALVAATIIPEHNLLPAICISVAQYPGETFKDRAANYIESIANDNININYYLALLYYKHKDIKKAGVVFYSILGQLKERLLTCHEGWTTDKLVYLQAKVFLKLENLKFAEQALQFIEHLNDDNVFIKQAFIAEKQGDLDRALQYIEKTNANNPKALLAKALLLKRIGKLEAACKILLKVSVSSWQKYKNLATQELRSLPL